jgi:hypothetical protein
MLLRHMYRLSLEDRLCWPMWFGLPSNESSFDTFQSDSVVSYMAGLQGATHDIEPKFDDLALFFEWLRDERKEFPTQGWCGYYLEQCGGDNFNAVGMLFGFMYEYIIKEMPDWFVEINRSPLPSQLINGLGVPRSEDIRNATHVAVCRSHRDG